MWRSPEKPNVPKRSAWRPWWRGSNAAFLVYAVNLLVCSVALFTLWTYATRGGRLVPDVEKSLIANVKQRMRIGILLYSLATVAAVLYWPASVLLLVGIQIVYLVPGHIDQHRWRQEAL